MSFRNAGVCLSFFGALLFPCVASAAVDCVGTVHAVYKWYNFERLSMQLKLFDGRITRWIALPTRSDEAMALAAINSGKAVHVYWASADVTQCIDGWEHNRPLIGYFVLTTNSGPGYSMN